MPPRRNAFDDDFGKQHSDTSRTPRDPPTMRPLSGWGGRPSTRSEVLRPTTIGEIVDIEPRPVGQIARGLGRSYGDAAQLAGGTVVDMTALVGVALDEARGRVTAMAGTSLGQVIDLAVPRGWFLPVTPGTRHVTVGGAIAADVHGKNHHRDGSFGQHVESLELIDGRGEKPQVEPGSDIFVATLGGMGLTGTVTKATFRLIPIETPWMSVTTRRVDDFLSVLQTLHEMDKRFRYSVAWLDLSRRGRGRGVVTGADHAVEDEVEGELRDPSSGGGFEVPRIRSGVVNDVTVSLFNQIWFARAPKRQAGAIRSISSFFYPLDRVGSWNRLYGEAGFLQYQFVVPNGAETALWRIAEHLAGLSTPVSLAVLKRLGESTRGHLSFPMPGWTLALDLPLGDADLLGALDVCDELVAGAGGRVYLAKDSRLRREPARAMYPRLGEWREVREDLDPQRVLRSNLSQRLDLTG